MRLFWVGCLILALAIALTLWFPPFKCKPGDPGIKIGSIVVLAGCK